MFGPKIKDGDDDDDDDDGKYEESSLEKELERAVHPFNILTLRCGAWPEGILLLDE